MSYVNKKTRVFREAGDHELQRKRSDGRMKTYQSATDARAWCGHIEDRRQHILELIRQGDGKALSLGKYIPIEAIIDILLANKIADIRRLEQENADLREFIKSHGLHYEEKERPPEKVEQIYSPEHFLKSHPSTTTDDTKSRKTDRGGESDRDEGSSRPSTAAQERAKQAVQAGVDDKQALGTEKPDVSSGPLSPKAELESKQLQGQVSKGPAGKESESVAADAKPMAESPAGKSAEGKPSEGKASVGMRSADGTAKAADGTEKAADGTKKAADGTEKAADGTKKAADGTEKAADGTGKAADGTEKAADGTEKAADGIEKGISKEEEKLEKTTDYEVSSKSGAAAASKAADSSTPEPQAAKAGTGPGAKELQPALKKDAAQKAAEDQAAAQAFLAGKSDEDQLLALRKAMTEKEQHCEEQLALAQAAIEQLEEIKDIVEERDYLKQQLLEKNQEMDRLKKEFGSGASPRPGVLGSGATKVAFSPASSGGAESDGEIMEIDDMEREIELMKLNEEASESDIMKKELEVLRRYCSQLKAIQEENKQLKEAVSGGMASDDPRIKEKLQQLDAITRERDRLKARVAQLEAELKNYGDLPEEVDAFIEKSTGEVSKRTRGSDSSSLHQRFDELKGLEDQVRQLKEKADQVDRLTKELEEKEKAGGDNKESEKLRAKIACLEKQLEHMKCKCKELEILRVERNCLKMRLDDLSHLKCEYDKLLKKTRNFDAMQEELALLQARCEELECMAFECEELRMKVERATELEAERDLLLKEIQDCECCMSNQEDEIKKLTCHINCLSNDLDNRQDQMKVKVVSMRAHLEKKDNLISNSEQKLADVQEQLRNSIEQLSKESSTLRHRIEELETQLCEKEKSYKSISDKLEMEKIEKGKLEEMLSKAITGDEHLKQMLKRAKCAVKCISQKLEKHEIGDAAKAGAERENLLLKIKQLENDLKNSNCGADRIVELEKELKAAYETIGNLQSQLDKIQPVEEENKALRRHSSQLQETAKDQVSKLEAEIERLQKFEKMCEELQKAVAEKDKLIGELREQINQSASGPDVDKLLQEVSVLQAEIDRLNFHLQSQKKEFEDSLNKQISKSQNEIDDVSVENKDLKDQINKLKQELASKSKVDDSQKPDPFAKERDDLLKQIEAQKVEISDLLNKIKQPSSSEDAVTLKELEKRSQENDNLKSVIADLEKQLKDLKSVKADVPKASAEFENTIKDLTKKLEKSEKMIEQLQAALRKCNENQESGDLMRRNESMKDMISDLQAENARLKSAANRPSTDKDQKDTKQLEDELAKQKKECSEMIASLKAQYDRDISNLQKQNRASIDKLQKSQQDVIKKIGKQHESELTGLKSELRKSELSLKKVTDEKKKKSVDLQPIKEVKEPKKSLEPEPAKEQKKSLEPEAAKEPKKSLEPEPAKEPKKSLEPQPAKEPNKSLEPEPTKELAEPVEEGTIEDLSPPPPEPPREPAKESSKRLSVTINEGPTKEPSATKRLSIATSENACICSRMPAVLPIPPLPIRPVCQPPPTRSRSPPCTCSKLLSTLSPRPRPSYSYQPPISSYGNVCVCPPSKEDDKVSSIKKIAELENKLLAKQQHTKDKIETLQTTVDKFKRQLELERQRNSDLINRYSNQQKTVANMKVEIDLVKRESFQDKKKLQHLNMAMKKIMEEKSGIAICGCPAPQSKSRTPTSLKSIPHFHTELTLMGTSESGKFQHNCVMKKAPCTCSGTDRSSDSLDE